MSHDSKVAERMWECAHWAWAFVSASQGILSICYFWIWYAMGEPMGFPPAIRLLLFFAASSTIFGLGGAVVHWYGALEHRARAKSHDKHEPVITDC